MFKYIVFAQIVINVLFFLVNSQQIDPNFCNLNTIISDDGKNLSFPLLNQSNVYSIFYEVNIENSYTEELKEYYDGFKERASSMYVVSNKSILYYMDYTLNELLTQLDETCLVSNLNQSYSNLPFKIFYIGDKNEIATPLNILTGKLNVQYGYLGSTNRSVRGVPVREWQACAYSEIDQTNIKLTVSYSNADLWTEAVVIPGSKGMPVQLKFETKDLTGNINQNLYTVFQLRSDSDISIDELLPPRGVYCPNKKSTKKYPILPRSFSFRILEVLPDLPDRYWPRGTFEYNKEEFDYENKLVRVDQSEEYVILDYSTGYQYSINPLNQECQIANLTSQFDSSIDIDGLIHMKNTTTLFDFYSTDYYYVGKRIENGLVTDVWIGRSKSDGSIWEWYFFENAWISIDATPTPYLVKLYFTTTDESQINRTFAISNGIYEFRNSEVRLMDFDVSMCFGNLAQKEFVFTMTILNQNIRYRLDVVKSATIYALKKVARVVPVRISNVELLFGCRNIYFGFKLYDRVPQYGNVMPPIDDVPFEQAIQYLKSYFAKNQLEISYEIDSGSESVFADKGSLIESNSTDEFYSLLNAEYVKSVESCVIAFCNTKNIVSDDGEDIPFPYINQLDDYYMMTEKMTENFSKVIEYFPIEEYYAGLDDLAVIRIKKFYNEQRFYKHFKHNELLSVMDNECEVKKLDQSTDDSIFTLIDKFEATPLNLLSRNSQLKFVYLGSKNRYIRDIPVREWRACAFSNKTQAELKITVSFSNSQLWQGESVPVQIRISKKFPNDKFAIEHYNIIRFEQGDDVKNRDFYIPSEIYCKGWSSKKEMPKLPKSYSLMTHVVEEDVDSDGELGVLTPFKFEYDTDKNLQRIEFFDEKRELIVQINDFNSKLTYVINTNSDSCIVVDSIFQNYYELFLLNDTSRYEYIGMKYVKGIRTDVWIAPSIIFGETILYEWHFMASAWGPIESGSSIKNEPVLLKLITTMPTDVQVQRSRIYYEISSLSEVDINLYDFDISSCMNVSNKHLRFKITLDEKKFDMIRKNQGKFRDSALMAVHISAKINPIRVSKLDVILDNKVVYVTFTLLDKLNQSFSEKNLEEAYNNLENDFKKGTFSISFQEMSLKPDVDSLVKLTLRNGRYTYSYVKKESKNGITSLLLVIIIFAALLVGFIVGLLGIGYLMLKRSYNINIPGAEQFFNPIYDDESYDLSSK